MMNHHEELILANDLCELSRLAEWLESYGETHCIDAKTMMNVNLVLDELATNVINYGYPDAARERISVELWQEDGCLVARLSDDGIPFNPLEAAAPKLDLGLDEREIGGLGIHFVRTLIDDASYSRDTGKNALKLIKKLPSKG